MFDDKTYNDDNNKNASSICDSSPTIKEKQEKEKLTVEQLKLIAKGIYLIKNAHTARRGFYIFKVTKTTTRIY